MSVRELTEDAWDFFNNIVDGVARNIKAEPDSLKSDSGPIEVPWMETAEGYMGLREIRGRRHNKTIMGWAKQLGKFVDSVYKSDEIAWCGLFVAACLHQNGISAGFKNPLGARNWLKHGKSVDPCYGSILVFWRGKKRGWQGHVGFYVSEDKNYYHVLGGNQSNSVNVTKIAKSRLLGARWPKNYPTLHENVKSQIGKNGRINKRFDGAVSTNEA